MHFIKNDPAALAAYIELLGQGLVLFDSPACAATGAASASAATAPRAKVLTFNIVSLQKDDALLMENT